MPAGRSSPARLLVLATALATIANSTGCGSAPPPKDARVTAVPSSAPEPFQEMRTLLVRLGRVRDDKNAAQARALFPNVVREGKHLLTMPPPENLKRENVPRFLDGRATFTESLNSFGRAVAGSDDAALWTSSRDLDASFWAWFDAYRGKPSEGAV
jgi:hypothetical protein